MAEEKLPAQVDLSSKELRTRVEDELKNLLESIRASDNVYPGDEPQHMQELRPFTSDRSQKVRLKEYPNIQKLFKSFIADFILDGGGKQPYEPHAIDQFLAGTKQFYRESTDLATEDYFDVNIISELGFSSSPDRLKKFLKGEGITGQTGLNRGLREVFRYFTGSFKDTGSSPVSIVHRGRNPQLNDILKSLPFLRPIGEGRFIVKLLTSPEEDRTTFADPTDLVPVYKKFRSLKPPESRTLPEQMQHLKAMKGEVKLPSQQGQDLLRYLVYEHSAKQDKDRQERLDESSEVAKRIEEKRKRNRSITFHPDQAEEIPEEELERIPIPKKSKQVPGKSPKPPGASSLADELRKRAAQTLEVENEKARKRLGIEVRDPEPEEKKPTKKPDPKGGPKIPGFGPLLILDQLYDLVPGMGSVDEQGRPVAKLDEQMTNLTG